MVQNKNRKRKKKNKKERRRKLTFWKEHALLSLTHFTTKTLSRIMKERQERKEKERENKWGEKKRRKEKCCTWKERNGCEKEKEKRVEKQKKI